MNTKRDEPKSKVQLLIGLLFFLLGGIGCIGGIGAYVRDTAIVREGLRATARIIDKDVMRDSSEGNEYEISYTFDIPAINSSNPSRSIEGQAYISKSRWQSIHAGDSIEVVYAKQPPHRNFPVGGGVTSLTLVIFASGLFGLFGVIGFWLCMDFFRGG